MGCRECANASHVKERGRVCFNIFFTREIAEQDSNESR